MTQLTVPTTAIRGLPAEAPAPIRSVARVVLVVLALLAGLLAAEALIRVKNRSMTNYDIEMWRYSKLLKVASANPILGHEHVPNTAATLQSVNIRLNELGMRGGAVPSATTGERRILLLGSSITLGWGVREEDVISARLQRMFAAAGQTVHVFNGGVGNYNAQRYVELFLTRLHEVQPTDIVVHYFINDAEDLEPGGGNFLVEHSQLAATAWMVGRRFSAGTGQQGLEDHYRQVYASDAPGYVEMKRSLARLARYAREHGIRVYLAMAPDVHNLVDYPFTDIHAAMGEITRELGWTFVDLYPGFAELRPQDVWAMPGDPHPNALGHQIMAEQLYRVLAQRMSNCE